jgi:hypothetical protein
MLGQLLNLHQAKIVRIKQIILEACTDAKIIRMKFAVLANIHGNVWMHQIVLARVCGRQHTAPCVSAG